MRVEVTAEDIAKGDPGHPENCAIACALRRLGIKFSSVGGVSSTVRGPVVYINGGKKYLPVEVGVFARAFDEREPVEPIAFDLDVSP